MSDFAFRHDRVLPTGGYLKKAKTGLWSAEYDHPSGRKVLRGYLSKAQAKAAGDEYAIRSLARRPVYLEEDN